MWRVRDRVIGWDRGRNGEGIIKGELEQTTQITKLPPSGELPLKE